MNYSGYGSTAPNTHYLSLLKCKKHFSDWKRDFAKCVVLNVAVPHIEELAATSRDDTLQLNTSVLADKHTGIRRDSGLPVPAHTHSVLVVPHCGQLQLTVNNRDATKFEFEFDNVRTSNVFNRFEIRQVF